MSIRLREFALACWCAFFAASGICTAGAQVILAGPSTSQKESPAPPLVVACSPTKPVVRAHESVGVVAFAVPPDGQPLQYTWKTEAGSFEVEGSEPQREAKGSLARWDPNGIQPSTYKLTVTVSGAEDVSATCSLEIVVAEEERSVDIIREVGRTLLVRDRQERKGYGLYSYLLLGIQPTESAHERYRKIIEAYLRLIVNVNRLEHYFGPAQLNVTYLPADSQPTHDVTADWALEHYDYSRARLVLSSLPGTHSEGPYIVSSFQPLRGAGTLSGPYLFQDLSHVPPSVVEFWVEQFLNQAAQERFWEPRTAEQLVLKLRTAIAVAAEGLPEVRKAVTALVVLTPPK